jgi:transketolase
MTCASWDIFGDQSRDYQHNVLPPAVKARVAIEQASTLGWERYVGSSGHIIGIIGMKTFGASALLKELQKNSASRRNDWSQQRRDCWARVKS